MFKKVFAIILVFSLVTCFPACGDKSGSEETATEQTTESQTVAFDLQSYKDKVSELKELIGANILLLYNVAKYEYNACKTLGSVSDSFVDSGFEWLEKNEGSTRDTVENADKNIKELYAEIIVTEIEGKEAEEIDTAIRAMYDAYFRMYKCATEPSGTINSYADNVNSAAADHDNAKDTLELFLK